MATQCIFFFVQQLGDDDDDGAPLTDRGWLDQAVVQLQTCS